MGSRCSDRELETAARGALRRDVCLANQKISVRLRDGCIELSGLVDGWTTRMRAHAAVQRVSRDATVVNQMRVVVPGAARREDGDIRRAALAALEWHALLPDEVIRVHVCRGRVRLCGRVEDEGARMDAEEAVRQLANVAGVINELEVAAKATSEPTRERRHARQGAERRT